MNERWWDYDLINMTSHNRKYIINNNGRIWYNNNK
jgi:hypothetical protein